MIREVQRLTRGSPAHSLLSHVQKPCSGWRCGGRQGYPFQGSTIRPRQEVPAASPGCSDPRPAQAQHTQEISQAQPSVSPSPTPALAAPGPPGLSPIHAAAFYFCSGVMKEVSFPQNLISRLRLRD